MARHRHLIAYDIADPKRLRRVIKIMEAYGDRLQYSVFLCDLSRAEFTGWRAEIGLVLDLGEDSVVVIDLGPLERAAPIMALGVPRRLPPQGATVV